MSNNQNSLCFVKADISILTNVRKVKGECERKDAPKSVISGEHVTLWPNRTLAGKSGIIKDSDEHKALEAFVGMQSVRGSLQLYFRQFCIQTPIEAACPITEVSALEAKVKAYEAEFNACRETFTRHYMALTNWWANVVHSQYGQKWGDAVISHRRDISDVRKSLGFGFYKYMLQGVDEKGLGGLENVIQENLYSGLVNQVATYFSKKQQGAKIKYDSLVSFEEVVTGYIERYAFMDSSLLDLKDKIDDAFGRTWEEYYVGPSKGKGLIELTAGSALWEVYTLCGTPKALEAIKLVAKPRKVSFGLNTLSEYVDAKRQTKTSPPPQKSQSTPSTTTAATEQDVTQPNGPQLVESAFQRLRERHGVMS